MKIKKIYKYLLLLVCVLLISCQDEKYKINYELNGGTFTGDVIEKYDNSKVQLPKPVKDGYDFNGWYINDQLVEFLEGNGDVTVTASWKEKAKTYKVDIVIDEKTAHYEYKEGSSINLFEPIKEGHAFIGWYINDVKVDKIENVKTDLVIVAKFTKNPNYYTVTFINDIDNVSKEESYVEGSSIELANVEKEGYTFLGWYLNDILIKRVDSISSNLTIIAKYIKTYKVSLINGEEEKEAFYKEGSLITFERPSKSGYIFLGWYENDTLISQIDNISRDYVLVAKFSEEINYSYYNGEVLLIDETDKIIELMGKNKLHYTTETTIKRYINNEYVDASLNDVHLGMENLYIKYNDDCITEMIIDGYNFYNNVRVAIRNDINNIVDVSTLYHDIVRLTVSANGKIYSSNNDLNKPIGATEVTVSIKSGKLCVKVNNEEYISEDRILIESDEEITITSINRGYGKPSYSGVLDFSIVNGRILVVNDVNMEKYLMKVVPSEMPASWNIEALKAQAVAARTYAVRDILFTTNEIYGFVVDDSVSSQVYNNQRAQTNSTKAINETTGIIMENDDLPIQIFYFSTTCGLTANANEVWIKDEVLEVVPYLVGKNLTDVNVTRTDEESMLNFFKTIRMTSPGGNSQYHRWHIWFTKDQLRKTLNYNMHLRYEEDPRFINTLVNDKWQNLALPTDIGQINDIYVGQRGTSGVVVSLIIETEKGTYRINNQFNIRFSIRPNNCGSDVTCEYAKSNSTTYTNSSRNDSILKSGFFALEWSDDVLHFYGGGNGHGVGMCQYGANYYASTGKTYREILSIFYSQTDYVVRKMDYVVKEYQELFK